MKTVAFLFAFFCLASTGCSHMASPFMGDVGDPVLHARTAAQPETAPVVVEPVEVEYRSIATTERPTLRTDMDSDKDGVFDTVDECRNTPGDVAVDAFGCPVPLYMRTNVTFGSNRVTASEEMMADLARMGRLLQQNPRSMVTIEGHTDDVGDEQANQLLSQQRAESIRQLLITHFRVAPSRIKAIGHGENHPLVSNATESGRSRNRRVEMAVNGYYRSETSYIALHRPYNFHFASGQVQISGDFKEKIDDLGVFLSENPGTRASIDGHTDNQGEPAINLQLSQQRADAVRQYLQEQFAIDPARLLARGHGERSPLVSNASEQGRAKNRRVTVTVSRDENAPADSRFSTRLSLRGRVGTATYRPLRENISIRFKANREELDMQSMRQIDELGMMLQKSPKMNISIEGHAVSGGDYLKNMQLSRQRAENVKRYLQSRYDIAPDRLHVISYGPDMPVADAGNNESVQIKLNRF